MLIAFFDDSKTKYKDWFGIGGFIINGEKLLDFDKKFKEILKHSGAPINDPSIDTEIKWSLKKGNWIRDNLDPTVRIFLYSKLLSLLNEFDATLLGTLFHTGRISKDNWNKWPDDKDVLKNVRIEAYTHAFERVQEWSKNQSQSCIVICDATSDKRSDKQLVQDSFKEF